MGGRPWGEGAAEFIPEAKLKRAGGRWKPERVLGGWGRLTKDRVYTGAHCETCYFVKQSKNKITNKRTLAEKHNIDIKKYYQILGFYCIHHLYMGIIRNVLK